MAEFLRCNTCVGEVRRDCDAAFTQANQALIELPVDSTAPRKYDVLSPTGRSKEDEYKIRVELLCNVATICTNSLVKQRENVRNTQLL